MKRTVSIFVLIVMCFSILSVFANDYHEFAKEDLKPQWPLRTGGPYYITGLDYYRTYTSDNYPDGEHNGIDISIRDAEVYPVYKGVVTSAGHAGDAGYMVGIRHNVNGKIYYSRYLHLQPDSIRVSVDEEVSEDTVIGISGGSGATKSNDDYGRHLHLDIVREDGGNYRDRGYTFDYYINNPSVLNNVKFQGIWENTNGSEKSVYWDWIVKNSKKINGDYVLDVAKETAAAKPKVYVNAVASDYSGIWYVKDDASLWQYHNGIHKKHLEGVIQISTGCTDSKIIAFQSDGKALSLNQENGEQSEYMFNQKEIDRWSKERQNTSVKISEYAISAEGITYIFDLVLTDDDFLVMENRDDGNSFCYSQSLAGDVKTAGVCGDTIIYETNDGPLYIGEIQFDPVSMYSINSKRIMDDVKSLELSVGNNSEKAPVAIIKNDNSLWVSTNIDKWDGTLPSGVEFERILDNVDLVSISEDIGAVITADGFLYSFEFEIVNKDGDICRISREPELIADLS